MMSSVHGHAPGFSQDCTVHAALSQLKRLVLLLAAPALVFKMGYCLQEKGSRFLPRH